MQLTNIENMKRVWSIIFVIVVCFGGIIVGCSTSKEPKTFVNPVIYSDVPDVDVIRVGEDYFMISTTMHISTMQHSNPVVL